MRVAVVGAGVTGLSAAHELARSGGEVRVTLHEKEDHLGGHAKTVDVGDGSTGPIRLDLGFMIFNQVLTPSFLVLVETIVRTSLASPYVAWRRRHLDYDTMASMDVVARAVMSVRLPMATAGVSRLVVGQMQHGTHGAASVRGRAPAAARAVMGQG
ncbi:uncharacterized protein C2845_PM02G22370 [Panicum miliaceum]|uniref:Amine oxidase domain-containing protein n=1 Tax=Panicum miliaceum TaxID=4540 RepID=A0A3L6S7P7_PANMI|nr:uncharacterized protein C2845_PM02G22370 [Panicum miliaceum]